MARGWVRRNKIKVVQVAGPWLDIDEGKCQRCGVDRRLFSPQAMSDLMVCAPCSQICAVSTIPNQSYGGDDDDEVEKKPPSAKRRKRLYKMHGPDCGCWECEESAAAESIEKLEINGDAAPPVVTEAIQEGGSE